jgi:hypothetical protein
MSTVKNGVKIHDDLVAVAEGARQSAVAAAGANMASVISAEVTFYKTVAKSCRDNLNYAGVGVAQQALRALGVTGAF